jgi:hypothetical protein
MVVLSSGMFAYVWGLLDKRDRLVEVANQQAAAATLFEELENDLATTFAVDPSGNAGVKGDEASIAVRCRGVARLNSAALDLGDLVGGEMRFSGGTLTARRFGRQDSNFETVSTGIQRLQLRYFNGTEWLDSFDSAQASELPVAVEAAVWFGDAPSATEGGAEETLREPDRIRIMVVPDGPMTAWKGGS